MLGKRETKHLTYFSEKHISKKKMKLLKKTKERHPPEWKSFLPRNLPKIATESTQLLYYKISEIKLQAKRFLEMKEEIKEEIKSKI